MPPKILILTLACAGFLCLLIAFLICSCKVAKESDNQFENQYDKSDYYAHNGRGDNNGNH